MKVTRKRVFIKIFFYGSILMMLTMPLYMYFSHNVAKLTESYPHINSKTSSQPDFILKNQKPQNWVNLKQISSYVKWAIIFSEDWSFYQHEGIDVEQIKVAMIDIMESKRFRGASTITQQMVKNVFLSNDRTLWRKIHEIILAHKVEKTLSKARILEVYLNVIEFGPNIYGIKNASYHYFNQHPSTLGPREAAFLAMLLPSPKRYYSSFKRKKLSPFATTRIREILKKMKMGKIISEEEVEAEKSRAFFWEIN